LAASILLCAAYSENINSTGFGLGILAEASPPSGSSNPFTREEIISMVATLRDACLGIIYLAVPDSKPVFDERRKFLEEIGFKTASNLTISKESYAKQRTAWIYLFKV